MFEHGEDSGPKEGKKEDTKPSDYSFNQPQDNNTPRSKIPGKYYKNAYQMHIGNWKILSWEGMSYGLIPEKASEKEV